MTDSTQLAETDEPGQALLPCGVRLVTLDNALNRAAQGLSVAEKRLMMIAVSKLDPRTPAVSPTVAPLVTKVSAAEYAEHAKVDMPAAYMALKAAAEDLHKRQITMREDLPGGGKRQRYIRVSMSWVGRATYHSGEGWIELAWWHEVMPYLTGLQSKFTQYQLQQAVALRSLYSWRLLELLTQHHDTGWLQITIEDFCRAMEATEKQEADFAAIRRKMIEPAVKELNDKDAWFITWEPIKAGRKVTALRFEFIRDEQLCLDLGKPPRTPRPQPRPAALDAPAPPDPTPKAAPRRRRPEPTEAELQAFALPGESRESALERWRARGPAAVLAAIRAASPQ
jgi:hypothetical protein